MRVSRQIMFVVALFSAILGGGVSLCVSSTKNQPDHHVQLVIALALVVLSIIAAGVVIYYQSSLRRALHNQDEAQKFAGLGSWERDLATGKGYWSTNLFRLFDLQPRSIAPDQEEFYSLLHPDDREHVRQTISNAISNAGNYEIMYRLACDTQKRVFVSRGSITYDANRKPLSIVGTTQDVTERQRQQSITEALIAQKDMFISRLGHDLNTPLTPLIALLPMVRNSLQDEKQFKRLDLCINSVALLRDLVASAMQLARRFQPLHNPLHFTQFNLNEQVNDVISAMNGVFSAHAIICNNLIDQSIMLYADAGEVETVFSNLLNNAVKFSPEGSQVVIDAEVSNCSVTISITDQGIGISEDELPHVFEEFYKADTSRHELGSSGLGLSICRQIIYNHGGLISATSPGKGLGTTITFTLLAGDAI